MYATHPRPIHHQHAVAAGGYIFLATIFEKHCHQKYEFSSNNATLRGQQNTHEQIQKQWTESVMSTATRHVCRIQPRLTILL